MPETADSEFSEADLIRRNNDELVATWGNLAHRVLTFTYRRFEGQIPQPAELDGQSRQLLERAEVVLEEVGNQIGLCRFRAGLAAALGLAQEVNRYLDDKAPWKTIGEDREGAATALYTALAVINTLKVALYPYLPFTCQRLHGYLGYDGDVAGNGWRAELPPPGQSLREPTALFLKLDPSALTEEEARPA
jgi:methionyl-tRNA synthetase